VKTERIRPKDKMGVQFPSRGPQKNY